MSYQLEQLCNIFKALRQLEGEQQVEVGREGGGPGYDLGTCPPGRTGPNQEARDKRNWSEK